MKRKRNENDAEASSMGMGNTGISDNLKSMSFKRLNMDAAASRHGSHEDQRKKHHRGGDDYYAGGGPTGVYEGNNSRRSGLNSPSGIGSSRRFEQTAASSGYPPDLDRWHGRDRYVKDLLK